MNISEVCRQFGIEVEYVIHYIEEQWIVPTEEDLLDEEDLARLRLIRELKEDFGVNDEGVPIILHLIDQLNLLRLSSRNHEWPFRSPQ